MGKPTSTETVNTVYTVYPQTTCRVYMWGVKPLFTESLCATPHKTSLSTETRNRYSKKNYGRPPETIVVRPLLRRSDG